jgi:hypothetical protein
MNNRDSRLMLAAQSAAGFALRLKDPPARITDAAKRLQAAMKAVGKAAAAQLHAKITLRSPLASANRARKLLLRKHLDPIAADGLEMFAGLPGIEDSLKVPRIKDAPEKYLQAAERIRRVAEEHEREYIKERNYDEDFLEQLDRAVQYLEAATRVDHGAARAMYSRATADVKKQIEALRRAFDALDTRMVGEFLDDDFTLDRWRATSRIPAKTGRPRKRKTGVRRGGRLELVSSPPEIPSQQRGSEGP